MAYDTKDGYVVLFGGADPSGDILGDTWVFTGGHWKQLHPVVSPPARAYAVMSFDPKDGYTVLFGGGLNDTWGFLNGTWTNLTAPGGASVRPPSLYSAQMAYDAADGYLLLFGGYVYDQVFKHNDTWKFLAGSWTQVLSVVAPPAALGMAMAYDRADGYVVLFDGCCNYIDDNTTWKYAAGQWSQLQPGASPPWMQGAGMIYDAKAHRVILFGSGGPYHWYETWAYHAGTWTNLTSATAPQVYSLFAFAYDPNAGSAILEGGFNYVSGGWAIFGETWKATNGSWTMVLPVTADPTATAVTPSSTSVPLWHDFRLAFSVRDAAAAPTTPIGTVGLDQSLGCSLQVQNHSTSSCNVTTRLDGSPGIGSLPVVYVGDAFHSGSSTAVKIQLTKALTQMSLALSTSSVKRLHTVKVNATVANVDSAPSRCYGFLRCVYRGPTGTVSWSHGGAGGYFSNRGSCTLTHVFRRFSLPQFANCTITYTAPNSLGNVTLVAKYLGDTNHTTVSASSSILVHRVPTAHRSVGTSLTPSVRALGRSARHTVLPTGNPAPARGSRAAPLPTPLRTAGPLLTPPTSPVCAVCSWKYWFS